MLTNLSVGAPGLFSLTTSSKVTWTAGIHAQPKYVFGTESMGHIAFADGRARRLGQTGLRQAVNYSVPATNRIMLP
jgi:hypothetical protein